MDDDLDDYKLDTTWHFDPNHVVHISFKRDHQHRGRKVRVENKWYRQRELGVGSCGVVHLETTADGRERAVKSIRKSLAERLKIDYKRELAAISTFSKAKNIFIAQIQPSWWVKIGDFGIAKRVRDCDATELRTATGIQGYEAPEIRGYIEVDENNPSSVYTNVVDIWSLGCVIYKAVAKHVPFQNPRDIRRFCDKRNPIPFPAQPLLGKLTTDGIDFLQSILEPKPLARPTADDALQHPWFVPDEEYFESLPRIDTELAGKEERSTPIETNTGIQTTPGHHSESQKHPESRSSEAHQLSNELARQPTKVVDSEDRRSRATARYGAGAIEKEREPETSLNHVEYRIGDGLLAGAAITSLIEAGKKEAGSLCRQGVSAYHAKNYHAAIHFFTKALMLVPGDPILLSNRADSYHKCKSFENALADAKAATAADPESVRVWYWLGLLQYELGDSKGSVEAFQTCIKREGFAGSDGDKKQYHKHAKQWIARLEAGQDDELPGRRIEGRGVFKWKAKADPEAVAMFTFDADQPGDLGFKIGDIIKVLKKTDKAEDWWTGMIGSRKGIFPSNYVEMRK